MNDADHAGAGLDLQGERHLREGPAKTHLLQWFQVEPPLASVPVHPEIALLGIEGFDRHLLVVAATGVKPRPAEPFQGPIRLGSPVDQIAHREETVTLGIERDFLEERAEMGEHAVNVSDHEVTAAPVAWEAGNHRGIRHRLVLPSPRWALHLMRAPAGARKSQG